MDGKSKDLTKEYIEQIKGLFPEAVTEVADSEGNNITHRVDMEKLAILLGEAALPTDETEYRQKYGEKFSFEWAGKRRAIAEAQKRSTGTLRPCPEESVDWDTTENLYIEGDNLEVLKLLQDSYLGEVKMIYIDPPYNTGKDFVYKDNYKDNLTNYLEQTNTTNAVNSEASGRYHTNWLNMMYPRLKLARNLLADDGVIFISIDDNEVSNLKSICDEIFGEDNFQGLISRVTGTPTGGGNKAIVNEVDFIVLYSKTNRCIIEGAPLTKEEIKIYDKVDEMGTYLTRSLRRTGGEDRREDRPTMFYPIVAPDNSTIFPIGPTGYESRWICGKDRFEEMQKEGLIEFIFNEKEQKWQVMQKFYLEGRLKQPSNLWKNIEGNKKATREVKELFESNKVFDFPKPVDLLLYALRLSVNQNDTILDFFSGSATTAHAVMKLNAEDGGNRKYICVQLPEPTPVDSEARKAGFNTIPEIAKERIRRAGKKILEEQKAQNGGLFAVEASKLDIGFKVFKLDRSNVKDWDVEFEGLSEKQAEEQLKAEFEKAMEILKDGRTELDLLYEVMLKLGLQLSSHVSEKEIEGKTAYLVGNGIMVASFAKELSYGQISKILDLKPDFVQSGEFKVVFADESFASDNDKTNAIQLFKQRGITNYEII